jgi:hypothetical protein
MEGASLDLFNETNSGGKIMRMIAGAVAAAAIFGSA